MSVPAVNQFLTGDENVAFVKTPSLGSNFMQVIADRNAMDSMTFNLAPTNNWIWESVIDTDYHLANVQLTDTNTNPSGVRTLLLGFIIFQFSK